MAKVEVGELRPLVLQELKELEGKGWVEQVSHQRGAERNYLLAAGLIEQLPFRDGNDKFVMKIQVTLAGEDLLRREKEAEQ